jgi:sugar phosphate isomerase/epimerase
MSAKSHLQSVPQCSPRTLGRREFLASLSTATLGAAGFGLGGGASRLSAQSPKRLLLGMDNFAVRAMKWKADALITYAAGLRLDSLFITDFNAFERVDESHLKELRRKADDQGLKIQLGSWSICPSSKSFKRDWGTAEEHLALGLRSAQALGSPVFRVILGSREDRATEGGIEARIEDTLKVLKSQRSRALDAGVKIAVENHAGDMQARELADLVERAGTDFVGVNFDSGNAAWTLESPLEALEVLGRYVVTTSLRDAMVWESENGARVQWTAMGEGCLDLKAFFSRFAQLCPSAPVHIETISGFALEFAYLKPEFWNHWPKARAKDFAAFVALAKRGRELPPFRAADAAADQAYQKGELERSIAYCRQHLGLGVK